MRHHWDHAFASGSVFKEPPIRRLPLIDLFIRFAEKCYGNYCIRRLWLHWRQHSTCGEGVRLGGNARLVNKSSKEAVRIGLNTICRGTLRIEPGGRLEIGDEVYIGDEAIISAAADIRIGSGTLLAHGVQIFDNTSHPIGWKERQNHYRKLLGYKDAGPYSIPSEPVVIGEHCWLGFGAVVLKGVSIGARSIIGAGSIITKNVPPDTLVLGSGEQQIRFNIEQSEVH